MVVAASQHLLCGGQSAGKRVGKWRNFVTHRLLHNLIKKGNSHFPSRPTHSELESIEYTVWMGFSAGEREGPSFAGIVSRRIVWSGLKNRDSSIASHADNIKG